MTSSACKSNYDQSSINAAFSTYVRDTAPAAIQHAMLSGPAGHQGAAVEVADVSDVITAAQLLSGYTCIIPATGNCTTIKVAANAIRDVNTLLQPHGITPAAGFRLPRMHIAITKAINVAFTSSDANCVCLPAASTNANDSVLDVDLVYTSGTTANAYVNTRN